MANEGPHMHGNCKISITEQTLILSLDDDGEVDLVVAQFREWLIGEVQAERTRREAQRAAWKAEQEALARRARFAVIAEART
jgi:hypothetical protein